MTTVLRRLGLLGANDDRRQVRALVVAALVLYAVGFAAFPPRAITNNDEGRYIEQTQAWLELASVKVQKEDPLTGETQEIVPGDYPMGMVALMAPCVAAFGWRGAFLPAFLSLLLAVAVTARWLADERRSPLFALVLLSFPALLVVGRLALSDATRTAAAAVGLWLFFRGLDRARAAHWLGSGLLAGAALSLRESAVLPFVPLFAGSVLRRDRGWGWLLLGGLIGTGLHLAANSAAFGDALFVRGTASIYPFQLAGITGRLGLYLLGLLVLVPGGLVLGLAYRGRRRAEIVATIALIFGFYLFQAYGGAASGFPKNLVIGLRYFAPLLPVLAFAMSESVPRLLASVLVRARAPQRAEALAGAAATLWVGVVLVASFAVHPVLDRWAGSQAEIRAALEQHVPRDSVLIANRDALGKFIDDLGRPYRTLDRKDLRQGDLERLAARHERYYVALLDRSDSAYWANQKEANDAFVAELPPAQRSLLDLRPTASDRLRIWQIDVTDGPPP